jgi:ATP-dependent helicase HrpB
MLIEAAGAGNESTAADLAAILVEQGLGGRDVDLVHRLSGFRADRSRRASQMRRLAGTWARQAREIAQSRAREPVSPAQIIALAFPDRIARSRGGRGDFILANGRGARLPPEDPLAGAPWLAVAELSGAAAQTRILLAAELADAEVRAIAGPRMREAVEIAFDDAAAAVRARRVQRLDAIVIKSEPLPAPTDHAAALALARGIARLGIGRLPWSKPHLQLRQRVGVLRDAGGADTWPDLSDAALGATIESWLAPMIDGRTALGQISAEDLSAALDALLPWSLRRRLDEEAPTHFTAPTGQRHAIDYGTEGGPSIELRVHELYGLKTHPTIAGGKLGLVLRLTSPAHRVIQITRDLPGFWSGSWSAVRADMRGRYPRHEWPDDPANAAPTTRAKRRPD